MALPPWCLTNRRSCSPLIPPCVDCGCCSGHVSSCAGAAHSVSSSSWTASHRSLRGGRAEPLATTIKSSRCFHLEHFWSSNSHKIVDLFITKANKHALCVMLFKCVLSECTPVKHRCAQALISELTKRTNGDFWSGHQHPDIRATDQTINKCAVLQI